MIQLLRRLLLLAGLCLASWHLWFTPPELIAVRTVDFEKEYHEKYTGPPRHSFGVMAAGERLIRETTNPGSAAAYRQERISARSVPPSSSAGASFARDLAAAAAGHGPLAARFSHNYVYFDSAHPVVAAFAAPLRASLQRTSFLNAYTRAGTTDLELMLFTEPRSTTATSSVLYPLRPRAALFAAAALALYLLLGFVARSSGARHDPLPLAVLDLVCAALGALFFGLPLLGGPDIFCWGLTLLLACALVGLARRAAWRLEFTESSLRLHTILSSTDLPLASIAAAGFQLSPDGSERTGLNLQLTTGYTLSIPWAGLIDLLPVLHYLRRHGLLPEPRAALMNS